MSTRTENEEVAKQWGGGHTTDCAWITWIAEGKYYPNPGCTCKTTEAYQKAEVQEDIYIHPGCLKPEK